MEQQGRGRRERAQHLAGVLLLRTGPAASGVAVMVAVAACLLVPFGGWRPWLATPLVLVGAVLVLWLVRAVPVRPVPVWTTLSVLAIAVGETVWAVATHAEHVVLRRDAGSYAWYTHWIATRGGLPVDARLDAFGGPAALAQEGFRLASPAFYASLGTGSGGAYTGAHIVPQFLVGSPAWFSFGWWTAGWDGLFAMPAIAGGLALVGIGGLAARLVGPRWAVLVTLVLAIAQPVIHANRSTYSEPLATLLVVSAAALFVDAVRRPDPELDPKPLRGPVASVAGLALAAGALLGLTVLFRIDGLREAGLALPVAAVLALRGHPAARPFTWGLLTTTALASAAAAVLSLPYLIDIAGSLVPLVGALVVLGAGSGLVVFRARRREARGLGGRQWIPAPRVSAGLVGFVLLVLASRPLWLVTRQDPNDSGSRNVASMQERLGLPIDGGRTYAEHSITWVAWYLGWVAVVAAGVVFVVLAWRFSAWWRSGERSVPLWLGPAVVGFGSTLLSLYRPSITPDHPWADRRLVPVVLPVVVIAAVAGVAWGTGRVRERRPRWASSFAAVGALLLLVPTWWATAPLAGASARTEQGELDAVAKVCAALHPGDVVLTVDAGGDNMWPQVIRDECGIPTVAVSGYPEQVIQWVGPIAERAKAAGSNPVLLAADGDEPLVTLGLVPDKVLDLATTEDAHTLITRPDDVDPLHLEIWLAVWDGPRQPVTSPG